MTWHEDDSGLLNRELLPGDPEWEATNDELSRLPRMAGLQFGTMVSENNFEEETKEQYGFHGDYVIDMVVGGLIPEDNNDGVIYADMVIRYSTPMARKMRDALVTCLNLIDTMEAQRRERPGT